MKGILFKPEVWKAKQVVLDQYREAQARRVIKPQPFEGNLGLEWECRKRLFLTEAVCTSRNQLLNVMTDYARYYADETVYLKEAFMFKKGADVRESYIGTPDEGCLGFPPHYLYKADDTEEVRDYGRCYKWRSPMMMPEHAARHFITITGVRAERLQEISIEYIKAEGINITLPSLPYDPLDPQAIENKAILDEFSLLWDIINPKYPWESNPWVFAYTFRRLKGGIM